MHRISCFAHKHYLHKQQHTSHHRFAPGAPRQLLQLLIVLGIVDFLLLIISFIFPLSLKQIDMSKAACVQTIAEVRACMRARGTYLRAAALAVFLRAVFLPAELLLQQRLLLYFHLAQQSGSGKRNGGLIIFEYLMENLS